MNGHTKIAFKIVKHIPVAFGVVLTAHCLLLLSGYDFVTIRTLCRFPIVWAVLCFALSKSFKMCIYHRLFIFYDYIMNVCIFFKINGVFDFMSADIDTARKVMLGAGSILIFLFLTERIYGRRKKCTEESNPRD